MFHAHVYLATSSVKNGLKVKQLAKQLPTLKTLMQKILVGLWIDFDFCILSSLANWS